MIRVVIVAGAVFLASCGLVEPGGCGISVHGAELGTDIYTGPDADGPIAELRAGDPLVCRIKVEF